MSNFPQMKGRTMAVTTFTNESPLMEQDEAGDKMTLTLIRSEYIGSTAVSIPDKNFEAFADGLDELYRKCECFPLRMLDLPDAAVDESATAGSQN